MAACSSVSQSKPAATMPPAKGKPKPSRASKPAESATARRRSAPAKGGSGKAEKSGAGRRRWLFMAWSMVLPPKDRLKAWSPLRKPYSPRQRVVLKNSMSIGRLGVPAASVSMR